MALIPYDMIPGEKDPPILIGEDRLGELYCGDARCDCVTGHVGYGGQLFSVDLGTGRVDLVERQGRPARGPEAEALYAAVVQALRGEGVFERMQAHYLAVREFGKRFQFHFINWADLQPGAVVSWGEIFRTEPPMVFSLSSGNTPPEKEEASGLRLILDDGYCVDSKCDCNRVRFSVLAGPGDRGMRQVGTVVYDFKKKEPAVLNSTPDTNPNDLFMTVQSILRGKPDLAEMYSNRYRTARAVLIPLIARQRQARTAKPSDDVGRNDPCPCGSGKKYKKCRGK